MRHSPYRGRYTGDVKSYRPALYFAGFSRRRRPFEPPINEPHGIDDDGKQFFD